MASDLSVDDQRATGQTALGKRSAGDLGVVSDDNGGATTGGQEITLEQLAEAAAEAHRSVDERRERGREARRKVPRSAHAERTPADGRADPVALLDEQNADRVPWLVPVRHGRMMVSPFTFYRGAARIMAADLAGTPVTGLTVQACGDAHLSNFGAYASPERQLVFDVNDFDETLPGPWEWDVKRLAASLWIAAEHRGFSRATRLRIAKAGAESYQQAMARFADMATLELWYDRLTVDQLSAVDIQETKSGRKYLSRFESKARSRDSLQALSKLTIEEDGQFRIRSTPPVLVPMRDLAKPEQADELAQAAIMVLTAYLDSIRDDRGVLLARFRHVDIALKVVGVGSVGTLSLITLLEGRDRQDPLFLQIKEATRSVLENHLPASQYDHHGRRVVEGQRLTQAASDILLGWTTGPPGRHFYVRQLRDWKGSVEVETFNADRLAGYARLCGYTLARGHARSGDAVAISAYLGRGDAFPRAIGTFSESYAAQNAKDYQAFTEAIDNGRIPAEPGV